MPNIRIKDIPTTASATSSTDFIGIDGSANGTRKLNAYSPTFGGNLTVSGTTVVGGGSALGSAYLTVNSGDLAVANGKKLYLWSSGNAHAPALYANGNNITFVPNSGSNAMVLDGSGNLTVSGTGTSSVAGSLGIGTTSPLANLHVANASSGLGTFNVGGTTSALGIQMEYSQGGFTTSTIYANNSYNNNAAVLKIGVGKTTNPNQLVMLGSGNLLIGTTTDGGQKLQVSGSAKIAGPTTIGAANGLTYLDLTNSGDSTTLELENNTSGHIIVGTGSKSLLLKTNSATALTLDSSQRCILSGALRLANTYVATPQVSTGYVTIQDSTGTTYKVLVAT